MRSSGNVPQGESEEFGGEGLDPALLHQLQLIMNNPARKEKLLQLLHFPADPVPEWLKELAGKNPRYYDLDNLGTDESTKRLQDGLMEVKRAIKNGTQRIRRRLQKRITLTDKDKKDLKAIADLLGVTEEMGEMPEKIVIPDPNAIDDAKFIATEVIVLWQLLGRIEGELKRRNLGQKWLTGMDPDASPDIDEEGEGLRTISIRPH